MRLGLGVGLGLGLGLKSEQAAAACLGAAAPRAADAVHVLRLGRGRAHLPRGESWGQAIRERAVQLWGS